jgi:hypothetical protein
MSPLQSILIYSILAAIATFLIGYYTTLKDDKKVIFSALVLVVLAYFLAYANYKAGEDAQAQSDRIEGSINVATKIAKLDTVIDNKTQYLVLKNDSLTDSIHKLIQKVDIITSSMHKETSEEIAENALTGKLDFHLKRKLSDKENVAIVFGGNPLIQNVKRLKSDNPPHFLAINSKDYGTVKIINDRILLTIKVFDFTGKWILEIKDNYWVRNRNNTGAFNYNDTSFEILDNYGNVALNLDLRNNNLIFIQGYVPGGGGIIAFGDSMSQLAINAQTNSRVISDFLGSVVTQIFYHAGPNWLHRRLSKSK